MRCMFPTYADWNYQYSSGYGAAAHFGRRLLAFTPMAACIFGVLLVVIHGFDSLAISVLLSSPALSWLQGWH